MHTTSASGSLGKKEQINAGFFLKLVPTGVQWCVCLSYFDGEFWFAADGNLMKFDLQTRT